MHVRTRRSLGNAREFIRCSTVVRLVEEQNNAGLEVQTWRTTKIRRDATVQYYYFAQSMVLRSHTVPSSDKAGPSD